MSKKGFTLIEITIVVIIIGILASIGLPQYMRVVEKGRTSEARTILGRIRSAQMGYFLEYETYTDNTTRLKVAVPTTICNSSFYYRYVLTATASTYTAWAVRCTTGNNGKSPDSTIAYNFSTSSAYSLACTEPYLF